MDGTKRLVCIECPRGCDLIAEVYNGEVASVTGNFCAKGATYAKAECVRPVRVVTTTIRLKSGEMLPVKTSAGVPKGDVIRIAAAISKITAEKPVRTGQILARNIENSGADVIAAKTII